MALTFALSAASHADIISLNFSENSGNQGFAGGELIGPLNSDSTNWNTTNGQPDLVTGAMTNLIDDSGTDVGVSVRWSSSNVWWNGDDTVDDQSRLSVGYLDDGGDGVSVIFDDIPYDEYRVYILLASDNNLLYDTQDFQVNGTWDLGLWWRCSSIRTSLRWHY